MNGVVDVNDTVKLLKDQEAIAGKNIEKLEEKKADLYQQRNQLTKGFLSRILQRRKIKTLDNEIRGLSDIQENYRIDMDNLLTEIESVTINEELESNIIEAKEKLSNQGLYIYDAIFSPKPITNENDITLEIDARVRKDFDHIPTPGEIINMAEKCKCITQISEADVYNLCKELNEQNFSVDENPYSYQTSVFDLYEQDNKLYLPIHDDTDAPFATLVYDGEDNKWKNDHYSLSVDNPIESIKNKYAELSLNKSTTERLSQVLNTIDLPNLNEDNEPKERQRLIADTLNKFNSAQINFINTKFDKEELDLFVSASESGITESYAEINYLDSQLQSTFKLENDVEKTISELESIAGLPDKMNSKIKNLEDLMTTKQKDQANYVLMNVEEFEFKNALKAMQKLPEKDLETLAEDKAQENKERLENSFEANYQKFLLNEPISKNEKIEIMLFDNSHSNFEKVSRRLEVLEKVRDELPDKAYAQKDKELSGMREHENQLKNVLSNEYKQMDNTNVSATTSKSRQKAMNNIKQQQRIEH